MPRSGGASLTRGRLAAAVTLAVVGAALVAVGVVLCVEPAGSLPAWLGRETVTVGGQQLPSPGYHPLRAVGGLIAGVALAAGALSVFRGGSRLPVGAGPGTGSR